MAEETNLSRLPLAGKRFFIDPKVEKGLANKLKQNLLLLGGVVEDFLDGNINFALTNEEYFTAPQKSEQPSPSAICSPFNTSVPSTRVLEHKPASSMRWKKIASKARSTRGSSTSLIDTARKLGIKIRYVKEVWDWLSKKAEKHLKPDIKPPTRPTEIVLREPCIKIEDFKHKPIYDEMDGLTYLDFDGSKNYCPFVNPSGSPVLKKSQKKKDVDQKGFCECCQCSYLSESKHCRSVEHKSYGELGSNYQKLDHYISNNELHLKSFLKRACLIVAQEKPSIRVSTQVKKHSPNIPIPRLKQPKQPGATCSSPTLNNTKIPRARRRSLSPQKSPLAQRQRLSRTRASMSPRKLVGETTSAIPAVTPRRTSPRKLSKNGQKTPEHRTANENTDSGLSLRLSPCTKRRSLKRRLSVGAPAESASPSPHSATRCLRSTLKHKSNSLHNMDTRKRSVSRDSITRLLNSSTSDV